ncbi:MAG: hypothetical protein RRB13_02680 [bacterium]|nr:hypothetical protein [bacterium]
MAQKTAQELSDAAASKSLTADQFAQHLEDLGSAIQGDLDQIHRQTALELFRRIVEKTPVDTGLARANWQLSDQLNSKVLELGPPQEPDLDGITAAQGLWLFNNLSYIDQVEAGNSGSAGAGAVAVSLEETKHWLEKELKKMGYL